MKMVIQTAMVGAALMLAWALITCSMRVIGPWSGGFMACGTIVCACIMAIPDEILEEWLEQDDQEE